MTGPIEEGSSTRLESDAIQRPDIRNSAARPLLDASGLRSILADLIAAAACVCFDVGERLDGLAHRVQLMPLPPPTPEAVERMRGRLEQMAKREWAP